MTAGPHSSLVSMSVAALAFVILPLVFAKAQDPCTDFVSIGSEKRSVQYIYDPDIEIALCDDTIDENKWYSFAARTGGEIPELNDVSLFHCGTDAPIFILLQPNGQKYHDTAKTTKEDTTAPVCASYGMEGSSCNWNGHIKIHWCEQLSTVDKDVFVYKLKRPDGCSMSYCAGELEACPPGYAWNQVQGQCLAGSPVMIRYPKLEGPTIVRTAIVNGTSRKNFVFGDIRITVKQFAFFCNIGYNQCAADDGARFQIYLHFDGVRSNITIDDANCTNLHVEIQEGLLQGHFGTALSCVVQSYWLNDHPQYSRALESDSFWIGIQAPVVTFINETHREATINFTSTVPITCWHCFQNQDLSRRYCTQRCSYAFILTPSDGSIAKCRLNVTDETDSGTVVVHLSTNAVIKSQLGARYQVTFKPYNDLTTGFRSVLWTNYKPPNASIQVKTELVQRCSTTGDPHILTLNPDITIHNYLLGDFTLLKSVQGFLERFLMIQVRHQTCGTVSCNCGVIVREGNSVYGVDACRRADGTNSPRVIRYLYTGVYDGSSVWRDGTGAKFMISMPSGLLVTVNVNQNIYIGQYLDIYVNIPSVYKDVLTGMCTQTPEDATDKHRITKGTSMFDTKPECQPINNPPADNCECDYGNHCNMSTPVDATAPVVPKSTGLRCSMDGKRKRREVTIDDSDDTIDLADAFYSVDYDPDHGRVVTKGDKTDEDALAHCDAALRRSAAYQQCATKIDLNGILNNCKEDVQIADNYAVAEAYASVMEKTCLDYVIATSNATSIEQLANIPSVRAVTSNICPNQCRQRGTCVNGECQCDGNFTGPDCGADINSPPVIRDLVGGGLCDLQTKQCARYYINAENVYDSSSMQGRFERFSLLTGENAGVTYANCSLYVAGEVACQLPVDLSDDTGRRMSMGYRVSISNDGTLYSNQLTLVVYDSVCLTCLDNGTCQQTDGTCFIDSVCYADGNRRNSTAECQQCVADTDRGTWTNICPDSSTESAHMPTTTSAGNTVAPTTTAVDKSASDSPSTESASVSTASHLPTSAARDVTTATSTTTSAAANTVAPLNGVTTVVDKSTADSPSTSESASVSTASHLPTSAALDITTTTSTTTTTTTTRQPQAPVQTPVKKNKKKQQQKKKAKKTKKMNRKGKKN